MKKNYFRTLTYYHLLICEYASKLLTNELLVEKIRQAPSTAEGVYVLNKFNSYSSPSKVFHFFTEQMKIEKIKYNQEILDYFKIPYPTPPKKISHLFDSEKSDQFLSVAESAKQLMIGLNIRIAEKARQDPIAHTVQCTSCRKNYVYKSTADLFICPLCGKSDEDDL